MIRKLLSKILRSPLFSRLEWVDVILAHRRKRCRIDFLEENFPKQGVGAELGVFKGHFSPFLLKHTAAKKLHLIDPWYHLAPTWDWASGNQSAVDGLIRVLKNSKGDIENGRVMVHVADDIQVLSSFPDHYFDWVYIDSSHDYTHTVQELEFLFHKVKPEGVIGGDDWQPDSANVHHGVYLAVNAFVSSHGYEVIYANTDNLQWAIRRLDSGRKS